MSQNHTQSPLKGSPHLSFLKRHTSCQIILIHSYKLQYGDRYTTRYPERAEEKDTDLLLSNDDFNIFILNTLYGKHDAGKGWGKGVDEQVRLNKQHGKKSERKNLSVIIERTMLLEQNKPNSTVKKKRVSINVMSQQKKKKNHFPSP